MKACVFDIETTDLAAVGAGWILCAVVLDADRGTKKVFRYDDMKCKQGRETGLIRNLLEELKEYPMWIGHNIERFDIPYIKSRASILNVPALLGTTVSYDTLKAFRRSGFKTVANIVGKPTGRLDHVADFFGIPQLKTSIYPQAHWKTVWEEGQDRKVAMDHLVDHCIRDVKLTQEVFGKLWECDPYPHFQLIR